MAITTEIATSPNPYPTLSPYTLSVNVTLILPRIKDKW
jgi:hypothetical protein